MFGSMEKCAVAQARCAVQCWWGQIISFPILGDVVGLRSVLLRTARRAAAYSCRPNLTGELGFVAGLAFLCQLSAPLHWPLYQLV